MTHHQYPMNWLGYDRYPFLALHLQKQTRLKYIWKRNYTTESTMADILAVLYTLAANVMESPTRWLHGFISRHDFEINRDSSYKSCSRDYFYIDRQQINMRNAAQMQIVSLNWWQYSGRVWFYANSAQPPNSHLSPKLKINMEHWNNSLHIDGTWYCPSDPYISSMCACL